jgi:hypothetical protein
MRANADEEASWEVLSRSFKPLGIKAIASALRLSYSTVAKWQEDPESRSESGARNPLDRLDVVRQTLARGGYPREAVEGLRWLARRAGYRLVRESDPPQDHDELLREVLALAAEAGDVQRVFREALRDGRITPAERVRLLKELREAVEQAARIEVILRTEGEPGSGRPPAGRPQDR